MGNARLNRARVGVLLLCVGSLFLVACSKNKPSDEAVRQSLVERFPAFVEVKDFSVEEAQNVGNDVEPVWRSRIKATAVISADTFEEIGRTEENPETKVRATFIKPIRKAGERVPVFGKATSSLYQGAWKSELELDGSPEQGLGRLKDSITVDPASSLIVIGTQEESAWLEAMAGASKRAQEAQAEALKKQQDAVSESLRNQKLEAVRIADAEKEERERLADEKYGREKGWYRRLETVHLMPGERFSKRVFPDQCISADDGQPGVAYLVEQSQDGNTWAPDNEGSFNYIGFKAKDKPVDITYQLRRKYESGECEPL